MNKTFLKSIVLLPLCVLALSTLVSCTIPEDLAKADNLRLEAQLHAEATRVALGAEATRIAGQAQLELDRMKAEQDLKAQSQAAAQNLQTQGDATAQALKAQSEIDALDVKKQADLSILEANKAATLSALKMAEAKTLANLEAEKANATANVSTAWIGPITIAIVISLAALAIPILAWGVSRAIVVRTYVKSQPESIKWVKQPEAIEQLTRPSEIKQLRPPVAEYHVEPSEADGQSQVISDDKIAEGTSLNDLGLNYHSRGQMQEALDTYQQALSLFKEAGDGWSESIVLANIGLQLDEMGRSAESVVYLEQCVARMEDVGHPTLDNARAELERVRGKLRRNRRSYTVDANRK